MLYTELARDFSASIIMEGQTSILVANSQINFKKWGKKYLCQLVPVTNTELLLKEEKDAIDIFIKFFY